MQRMRSGAAVLLCALSLVPVSAVAEWEVVKWGGDGTQWQSFSALKRVEISGAGTYKFRVSESGQPADLLNLVVMANAGDVTVYLETETGGPGCLNLGAVSFGANSQLALATVRVAGDAATEDYVRAHVLSGAMEVAGDVQDRVESDQMAANASLFCKSLNGLTVSSAANEDGIIVIDGDVTGTVYSAGGLEGIVIWGDVNVPIDVSGDMQSFQMWVPPSRYDLTVNAPILVDGGIASFALDSVNVRAD